MMVGVSRKALFLRAPAALYRTGSRLGRRSAARWISGAQTRRLGIGRLLSAIGKCRPRAMVDRSYVLDTLGFPQPAAELSGTSSNTRLRSAVSRISCARRYPS